MTPAQRIEYTRMALAIAGIQCDDEIAELLLEINDIIATKQGAVDLRDISIIRHKIKEKYNRKSKKKS